MSTLRDNRPLDRKFSGDGLHYPLDDWQAWCAVRLMDYGHDRESAIAQASFMRAEVEAGLRAHHPRIITGL